MTAEQSSLLDRHLPDPSRFKTGESALLPPLMRWLVATGRVGSQTVVAQEVPWLGRRVDLALLNGRGVTTAFELKIGRIQRVIEQAAYNRASFHRSWIVTGNQPREDGIRWATQLGVGLIVIRKDLVSPLVIADKQSPHAEALKRLRSAISIRSTPLT